MILDGQHRLASPVSPLGERRFLRLVPMAPGGWLSVHVAVVQETPEAPWELVTLRAFAGVRVLLAAMGDHSGKVREWLEIWVQTSPVQAGDPRSNGYVFNNAALDTRWDALADALYAMDRGAALSTGFEHRSPAPLWIDVARSELWPTTENAIELCTDESVLVAAGLPSYAGTLERFLWKRGDAKSGFLRVAGVSAVAVVNTPAWAEPMRGLLPLNP